ncbi:MAG TPA: hypothetical protein VNT01_13460 [Symbiobacteriaceae bacterium]|nr:hypothetical protein [Symbiobacteriaceae bacterium]
MQIISCSALILNEAGDRVLISRRSENRCTAPGLWEVIGGRLEFGEDWVGPGDFEALPFAANCRQRVADYFRKRTQI